MTRLHSMRFRRLYFLFLIIMLFVSTSPASAHPDNQTAGPIYIVSPGDSLLEIAARFDVLYQDLMTVNNISDPNQLFPGDQLIIPGLEGFSGILVSKIVPFR